MGRSEYLPGAVWKLKNPRIANRDFEFVILGPGSKPGYKRCLVRFFVESFHYKNFESEYSHRHLREYGVPPAGTDFQRLKIKAALGMDKTEDDRGAI